MYEEQMSPDQLLTYLRDLVGRIERNEPGLHVEGKMFNDSHPDGGYTMSFRVIVPSRTRADSVEPVPAP